MAYKKRKPPPLQSLRWVFATEPCEELKDLPPGDPDHWEDWFTIWGETDFGQDSGPLGDPRAERPWLNSFWVNL